MTSINRMALTLAAACAAAAAHATPDEDRVLASLKKAHPHTRFTSVARTPVGDLYEVWMGSNVAFVSSNNTRYILFGRMWDAVAMQDITAPKMAKAEQSRMQEEIAEQEKLAVPIDQLPLADAIRIVKGNGERKMVVFSDPACGYCKRLEPELDKLDNTTVYTFLVPFQGAATPAAIWCAVDRATAWRQYMIDGDASMLSADANCTNPIERNLALAQRLKVRGTPTMLFADGRRLDGYTDAADIESRLSAHPRQARTRPTLSVKEKS